MSQAEDEAGFTLIELLVVILIIGLLTAIVLPRFLSQQQKGQDASAKSDVRNMYSAVEACNAEQDDYSQCAVAAIATANDLNTISFPVAPTTKTFTIASTSKSGVVYSIAKAANGTTTRSCAPVSTGSCTASGTW